MPLAVKILSRSSLPLLIAIGACGHGGLSETTMLPSPSAGVLVKVLWPEGDLYHGGVEWHMRSVCGRTRLRVDTSSSAGQWTIVWPVECASSETMQIHLDLKVNWMRCEPPSSIDRQVTRGDLIQFQLHSHPDCRKHDSDP